MSGSASSAALDSGSRARTTGRSSAATWLAGSTGVIALTCVTVAALVGLAGLVGADARWLAAMGEMIAKHHSIPSGVPFAAAPTAHWHNAIVLAELAFGALESAFGDAGLMLAQVLAVTIAVIVMMRDATACGASYRQAGVAVLAVAIGALGSLVVARAQLFSVALFPLLMALLRSETRRPSPRIWLALPLIALWSNLHSGVLIGFAAMVVYLALVRFRQQPRIAIGVGVCALVTLCATPAGVLTISYYRGLLANEAAARGEGLWSPLSLTAPFDILLVVAALVLAFQLVRSRPRVWELVVTAVLALATIHASRAGVWLLLFVAVPAARGFRSPRWWDWVMPPLAALSLIGLVLAIARGPLPNGAEAAVVARAVSLAHGTPIVSDDVIDEQVALVGGRIWVGNPIDAFTSHDQLIYLDWLHGRPGGLRALRPDVRVVITASHSAAQRLMAQDDAFRRVYFDRRSDIYMRTDGARARHRGGR